MRPTNSLFQDLPRQNDLEVMLSINDRIALESQFISDFARSLSETVPKMVDAAKKYFTDLKKAMSLFSTTGAKIENHGAYEHQQDVYALSNLLRRQDYANLMPLSIYVPEGFTGNLADYAVHLRKSVDHAIQVVPAVLNPYIAFLSCLISSSEAVKDSAQPVSFLTKVDTERDSLNRDEGLFFHPGATHTRRSLGESTRRMGDWDSVLTELRAMNTALGHVSNTTVQQSVDTCIELLNGVKEAATSGHLDKISPENYKAIAYATLSIAREVEFYAIVRQRVNIFNVAVDETTKFLKTALK